LSIGYCNTFSTNTFNPAADTRTVLSSNLPDMFKFLGFVLTPTINDVGTLADKKVYTFKLFDGPTSSDPLFTFLLTAGFVATIAGNSESYSMMDDTYIQVDNNLYIEVDTDVFSSVSFPYNLTLMYC